LPLLWQFEGLIEPLAIGAIRKAGQHPNRGGGFLVETAVAGTGTVMREHTVRGYAEQAGFADCEVAPIENDFWRFYLLTP
jgi:hypothetical protein